MIIYFNFCYQLQKGAKHESDMTLEDMYNARYNFDEDDDDSDWVPSEKQIEVLKWFCVNCTMLNVDDVGNCQVSCLSFWLFSLCLFSMPSLLFSKLN